MTMMLLALTKQLLSFQALPPPHEIEMQTMHHEQSGLPETSYVETLFPGNMETLSECKRSPSKASLGYRTAHQANIKLKCLEPAKTG